MTIRFSLLFRINLPLFSTVVPAVPIGAKTWYFLVLIHKHKPMRRHTHTHPHTYTHIRTEKLSKANKNFRSKKHFSNKKKTFSPGNRYVGIFPREWYYPNAFFHIIADHVN